MELRLLVVEGVLSMDGVATSSMKDLTMLRKVSRVWRDCVDSLFIENWVQRLPVEGQFAASRYNGVQILLHHTNGRGSFVHTFGPSFILLYIRL
jgi:hypothetical protein